jgi:hypothetical protein
MKQNISITFSLLAFLFAILTFCITKTNFILPQIDTSGFLVSVLTILVTVLVGWQIYTAIKIDERIKTEVNKKVNKLKERLVKDTNDKIFIIGFEFYSILYTYSKQKGELILQLRDLMCILNYGGYIENIKLLFPEANLLEVYSNELIKLCTEKSNEIENFSNEEKEMLLRLLKNSPNNIKGFNILKTILGDL